jgi:hypothetical protein
LTASGVTDAGDWADKCYVRHGAILLLDLESVSGDIEVLICELTLRRMGAPEELR